MKNQAYTIKARLDRDGNIKETPKDWLAEKYELTRIEIGHRGFLNMVGYNDYGLDTSAIQEVRTNEKGEVTIVTHNTIYILEPVKDEWDEFLKEAF